MNGLARRSHRLLGMPLESIYPGLFSPTTNKKQDLLQAGLSETHAENYTTLGRALREGYMQSHARANKPQFGNTKLEDFAKEFAVAFNS